MVKILFPIYAVRKKKKDSISRDSRSFAHSTLQGIMFTTRHVFFLRRLFLFPLSPNLNRILSLHLLSFKCIFSVSVSSSYSSVFLFLFLFIHHQQEPILLLIIVYCVTGRATCNSYLTSGLFCISSLFVALLDKQTNFAGEFLQAILITSSSFAFALDGRPLPPFIAFSFTLANSPWKTNDVSFQVNFLPLRLQLSFLSSVTITPTNANSDKQINRLSHSFYFIS